MSVPSDIRFRADYRRRFDVAPDGVQTHTISYPLASPAGLLDLGEEIVGKAVGRTMGRSSSYDADGNLLSAYHPDIDAAIIAVIKHDQAKWNL